MLGTQRAARRLSVPGCYLSAGGRGHDDRGRTAAVLPRAATARRGTQAHREGDHGEVARPEDRRRVIHQFLLTCGRYGRSMDLPHQQRLRDTIRLEIGDGTAQIMMLIIARERIGRIAVQYEKGEGK